MVDVSVSNFVYELAPVYWVEIISFLGLETKERNS